MSETIIKIWLSELSTVRLVCKCGGVAEVPLEKLGLSLACPVCRAEFDNDLLKGLSGNIQRLCAKGDVKVQFVLPEPRKD